MRDEWQFETAQVRPAGWMASFSGAFTAPTWQRVLVLLVGTILTPGAPDRGRRSGTIRRPRVLAPVRLTWSNA
jgi:hypothetical protein